MNIKRQEEKRNRNKLRLGFTLAELLVVVAITIILAGFGFVAVFQYQKNLHLTELDNTAREIFVAAQNHLTVSKASGAWDKFYTPDDNTDPVKTMSSRPEFGVRISDEPSDYPKEERFDDKRHDYRYVILDDSTLDTYKVLVSYILPAGSIDETLRPSDGNNHTIVIEYDANLGVVYGVWYTDGKSGWFGNSQQITNDNLMKIRTDGRPDGTDDTNSKNARKNNKPQIGYYGGGANLNASGKSVEKPDAEIVNADYLYLRVAIKDTDLENGNSKDNPQVFVQVSGDVSQKKTEEIKLSTGKYDLKSNPGGIAFYENANHEIQDERKADSEYACYLLDSVTNKKQTDKRDSHFASRFKDFYPGEDITLKVVEVSGLNVSDPVTLHTNSLFASVSANDNGGYTANIKYGRHLQNLGTDASSVDKDNNSKFLINSAWQAGNINWAEFVPNEDGAAKENRNAYHVNVLNDPVKKDNNTTVQFANNGNINFGRFYGLINDQLISYDGNYNSISNLGIQRDLINSYAGLISLNEASQLTLQNLTLIDPRIYNGDSGTANVYAGYFIGQTKSDTTIQNCEVRLSGESTISAERAGGIIGSISDQNGTKVNLYNVKLSGDKLNIQRNGDGGYGGGLIGCAMNNDSLIIENSSVDLTSLNINGKTHGVGGIIGSATVFNEIKIENTKIRADQIVLSGSNTGGIAGYLNVNYPNLGGKNDQGITLSDTSVYIKKRKDNNLDANYIQAEAAGTSDQSSVDGCSGGLVGLAIGKIDVKNCYAFGGGNQDLISGRHFAGGLFGRLNADGKMLNVSDSAASLYVKAGSGNTIHHKPAAGGFAGYVSNTAVGSFIKTSYSAGRTKEAKYTDDINEPAQGRYNVQVSADVPVGKTFGSSGNNLSPLSGGFIGLIYNDKLSIESCYSTSSVYNPTGGRDAGEGNVSGIGSFIGGVDNQQTESSLAINKCYSTGKLGVDSNNDSSDAKKVSFIGYIAKPKGNGSFTGTGNYFLSGINDNLKCIGNSDENILNLNGASTGDIGSPFEAQSTAASTKKYDEKLDTYPYKTVTKIDIDNTIYDHVGDWVVGEDKNVPMKFVNGNKLTVHFALPKDTTKFTLSVTGHYNGDHTEYAPFEISGNELNWYDFYHSQWFNWPGYNQGPKALKTCSIGKVETADEYKSAVASDPISADLPSSQGSTNDSEDYVYVRIDLDDISAYTQYEDGPYSALFYDLGKFVPGEDITVRVKPGDWTRFDISSVNGVSANSIFANGSNYTSNGDNPNTALIANARHLENLNPYISSSGKSNNTSTQLALPYTKAKQIANIHWISSSDTVSVPGTTAFIDDMKYMNSLKTEDKVSIYGWYGSAAAQNNTFYPIYNSALSEYDGGGCYIENITIEDFTVNQGGEKAALFYEVKDGFKLHDLNINNINCNHQQVIAAALIGNADGSVNVSNVNITGNNYINSNGNTAAGVINYAAGKSTITDTNVQFNQITGTGQDKNSIGGLIGTGNDDIIIKNSNVTVTGNDPNGLIQGVGNNQNVGGIIGSSSKGADVENSSITVRKIASLNGSGEQGNAGGVIGRAQGAVNIDSVTVNITESITSDNGSVGGLIGRHDSNDSQVTIKNSPVTVGQSVTTTNGNAGGVVGYSASSINIQGIADSAVEGMTAVSVETISGNEAVGGIIGKSEKSAVISKIRVNGNNTLIGSSDSRNKYVGGLVGYSTGALSIDNGIVYGSNIRVYSGDTSGAAGGLIGYYDAGGQKLSITDSAAAAYVYTKGTNAGGIAGYINSSVDSTMNTSYVGGHTKAGQYVNDENMNADAHFNVIAENGNAGGFIGGLNSKISINNSYSTASAYGRTAGGFIGNLTYYSNDKVTVNNCYATGLVGGPAGSPRGSFIGSASSDRIDAENSYYLAEINPDLKGGNSNGQALDYDGMKATSGSEITVEREDSVNNASPYDAYSSNNPSGLTNTYLYKLTFELAGITASNGLSSHHYGDWPDTAKYGTLVNIEYTNNSGDTNYNVSSYDGEKWTDFRSAGTLDLNDSNTKSMYAIAVPNRYIGGTNGRTTDDYEKLLKQVYKVQKVTDAEKPEDLNFTYDNSVNLTGYSLFRITNDKKDLSPSGEPSTFDFTKRMSRTITKNGTPSFDINLMFAQAAAPVGKLGDEDHPYVLRTKKQYDFMNSYSDIYDIKYVSVLNNSLGLNGLNDAVRQKMMNISDNKYLLVSDRSKVLLITSVQVVDKPVNMQDYQANTIYAEGNTLYYVNSANGSWNDIIQITGVTYVSGNLCSVDNVYNDTVFGNNQGSVAFPRGSILFHNNKYYLFTGSYNSYDSTLKNGNGSYVILN